MSATSRPGGQTEAGSSGTPCRVTSTAAGSCDMSSIHRCASRVCPPVRSAVVRTCRVRPRTGPVARRPLAAWSPAPARSANSTSGQAKEPEWHHQAKLPTNSANSSRRSPRAPATAVHTRACRCLAIRRRRSKDRSKFKVQPRVADRLSMSRPNPMIAGMNPDVPVTIARGSHRAPSESPPRARSSRWQRLGQSRARSARPNLNAAARRKVARATRKARRMASVQPLPGAWLLPRQWNQPGELVGRNTSAASSPRSFNCGPVNPRPGSPRIGLPSSSPTDSSSTPPSGLSPASRRGSQHDGNAGR